MSQSRTSAKDTTDEIDIHDLYPDKQIGFGGAGTVYLGTWKSMQVAIKKITANKEFKREKETLTILRELNAPNIVQYFGYSIDHAKKYIIVMEYIPNGSLNDVIYENTGKPFEWSIRYNIVKNIVNGVSFLHNNNIIHGDIKSPNVLLDTNWQAKLCDFNFAMAADDPLKQIVGTPKWAAPELTVEPCNSRKSDVFSLTSTIWETSTWSELFPHKHPIQFFCELRANRDMRETIPPDCPPKLAKLITWGWRTKPDERPTAKELLTELEPGLDVMSEKLSGMTFS